MECPDENTFAAFVDGDLSEVDRSHVTAHVDGCDACQLVLSELARVRSARHASGVSAIGAHATAAPGGAGPPGVVGRYVLQSALGRGGMGVVHRAWDPVLARHVAIKLIRPDRADAGASDRMLREARAMAAVSHPNVVQVHDAGVVDGDVWIAMELVDGEPLSARLARERLEPRAVLALFRQAAQGLERAHAAGILHRDFKPSNVFVDPNGLVKVGDFGLSRIDRAIASSASPNPFEAAVDETVAGAVVGTIQYMAPEQMLGRAVDARADQFSFAVALHHALFGEFPFRGSTIAELRAAFVYRAPTPPENLRDVPPSWVPILGRALAVHPEERFATMADLVAALEQADDQAYAGHLRVHVLCQLAFGACHLVATVVFAVAMIWGVTLPKPPEPPAPPDDPSRGSLLAGFFTVVGLLLWIAFVVFGTVWAPLNAWGLSKRHPWARTSTLAYAALGALTCVGVPYAVYAVWSLTKPAAVWAFTRPKR